MLSFVPYLVFLAFIFLLMDFYCLRPGGVLRRQMGNLLDTKNERTFGNEETTFDVFNIVLLVQWFLFFGLIVFAYAEENYYDELSDPNLDTLVDVGCCVAIPAAWYYIQYLLYHWWTYLFRESGGATILSRIYKALYMMSAPLALLVFLFEMAGVVSPANSFVLLIMIFIIAQIVFILSGIRIFWSGIGTLCFIILYLCAFKIAPILLIMAKLGV